VAAELAPIEPVAAMTPKASAKVASAAAAIRRRILLMRRARARIRSRTTLEVGFSGMGRKLGAPCEIGLCEAWESAERHLSARSQAPRGPLPARGRIVLPTMAIEETPFRGGAAAVELPAPRRRARPRAASLRLPRPELAGLLVLAAVLNLWALDRNGWANQYYSAAVRSMSSSWHDFLYGSFDASGVMTVDKPPLALWVQALSVRAFGYHPLSVLVPQALMGVASVALVYDLTRRRFGRTGGFVAGFVLATTPIAVAISRHNNPDALLVLCCTAAVWCLVRALDDGRTRWLVLCGACVGLGFEAKMAVALMVVPAIAAAWLWVAPRGRGAAARQLLAGGATMVAVGGAWPLLMALTPASQRPWISGTSDNSVLSLIFGYNGLGRLDGQPGGPQALGGGGGGGGFFGGATGPLRLLNPSMGGQAGWLLGFAVVAAIGIVGASRLRRSDRRTGWLVAVGGAFLTIAVAFSFAKGIFHPYYVSLLAPFTAALVGAGAAELVSGGLAARIWGPLAIAGGVATELVVLHDNPGELGWLVPLLVMVGVLGVVGLAAQGARRVRAIAVAAVLGALLIAPATWAAQTVGHAANGTFPAGGPATAGMGGGRPTFGPGAAPGGFPGGAAQRAMPGGGAAMPGAGALPGGGGFGGDSGSLSQVLSYVRRHGGGTIAVSSQSGAASQIIASGADVAGLGGFSGRESEVSVSWLADAVRSGRIRWILVDGTGGGGFGGDARVGASRAMQAVAQTCRKVATTNGATLYDCQGRADALAAL
jgi:4-amino-4-deoxy-L-arabinose transferase-like glycosyltransferase